MVLPSYSAALSFSSRLSVLDQKMGALLPFELNHEQQSILQAALRTRRLVIGKGRQVGCSTVLAFLLMLIAIMNPGLPLCIVADEQKKAEGILSKIKGWLSRLHVRLLVDNVRSITLVNGASIDALSAISHADEGESRVGRTKSYGVIHATEQSFWRNAGAVWAALTSTMLSNAILWNESTGAPGETKFREIFEGDGWQRLFFGVEQHENYRADPSSITDEQWRQFQADFGFSRRDSAAWWLHKLQVDFKGDSFRMLREFPVVPAHMFIFREGQHIQRWREVPVRVDGDWNFYEEPLDIDGDKRFDEPTILGVDTALGIGLDASALALIGHRTGRLKVTWRSNVTSIPAFIEHVRSTITRFSPIAHVVESNGCGAAVWQSVSSLVGANEQQSGDRNGELFERRDRFRYAVESGDVPIGGHLVAEAKSSVVNKRGKFEGMDDVISAVSFARKWRDENPWREPPGEYDPMRYSVERKLRRSLPQTW